MFPFFAVIPFVQSLAAALTESVLLGSGAMAAIPVCVALLPAARRRENVFAYTLAAAVIVLSDGLSVVVRVPWAVLSYYVAANTEQLVLGHAVRRIWPRQKRTVFTVKNERK